ncbi:MAG: hypothetical protein NVS3B10_07100 [Polyangiales bacterium]
MLCMLGCGGGSESNVVLVDDTGAPTADGSDAPLDDAVASGDDPPSCAADAGGGGAPSARGDASGALDPSGRKLLVFGGDTAVVPCGATPTRNHVGDSWLLDVGCGTWRSIPGDGPGARARQAMAVDGAGRAILFGGRTRTGTGGPYTLYADVWAFDFAKESWAPLDTKGSGPSPRANTAMAISIKRGKAYVFGGNTSTDGLNFLPQNDVFALDLQSGQWTAVGGGAATKPPAREFHAVALDDESGVLYAYSGGDAGAFTGPFLDDLWALDLAKETWSKVSTTGPAPRPRIAHAMVWDSTDKRLVVFGGHDDGDVGNQNDLWTIDPTQTTATWQKSGHGDALNKKGGPGACSFPPDFTTIDKAAPERRQAFAFGARRDGHAFVIFGGKGDCGVLADAWWYSVGKDAWTPLAKSPVGLSCLRYSSTCSGLCG